MAMDHRFQDSASCQSEVREFWQARFPKAVITTFRFFHADVAWGTRGFIESAERLLKEVLYHRTNDPDITCVALCHELGGCLFQQALILAEKDKKYHKLSLRMALIIYCDIPDFKDGTLKFEKYVLHLLSKSDLEPYFPAALMEELPRALESLSWEYAGISAHHRSQSHKSPWAFSPGDDSTEAISDKLCGAVGDQLRSVERSPLGFLLTLSVVDKDNHQVRLQKPAVQSTWWNLESGAYQEWKSMEECAPNILHVYNLPESSSAMFASQLFFETQGSFENAITITYALQKQDLRTQVIEAFYVSVIRQILQIQPSLFHHITFSAGHFQREKFFSYVVLQSVLLTLLRASFNRPVVLILSGVQDGKTSLVGSLINLVKKYRQVTTGGFKVIMLTEGNSASHLQIAHDICSSIDTSDEEMCRKFYSDFVSSKMESIVRSRPQWKHVFEATAKKLATTQSVMQTGLTASYLETWSTASTPNAMKEALRMLPGTFDEVFMMTIRRCEEKSSLCIRSLIRWILHAVRPLTIAELSVVAALSALETPSIEFLKQELPFNLTHDLEDLSKTLIEVAGTHISPIYGNIGSDLVDNQGVDSHSMILLKCLDYLESVFSCHVLESDASMDDERPEVELLEYAVREWPQHYKLATAASIMRDRVLHFLEIEEQVQAWFKLYQKYTNFSVESYYELDNGLKVACWFGLLDVVEKAIEKTKQTEDNSTELTQALDLAAGNGQANVVDLLLRAGASYEFGLCWASQGCFDDIVARLLDVSREAIDKRNKDGRTPLISAALRGNEQIAAYLLENGANPNLAAGDGINALQFAVLSGEVAIVQMLIDAKVDVNAVTDNGNDALRLAASAGYDDIVRLLLPHETDIDEMNKKGMTPFHMAVFNGHTSVCDLLFQAGASIHKTTRKGFSSLHIAAQQGFVDVVRWLFSKQFELADIEIPSCEVNGENTTPEEQDIVMDGKDDKTDDEDDKTDDEDDKAKGDDPNDLDGYIFDMAASVPSPLQIAARNGNIQVVHELLKHTEYNTGKERSTSLLLAAGVGSIEIVEEILNFGTITAIRNSQGNTALHLAATGHPIIVLRLLKLQSDGKAIFDINAKNKLGGTPLHIAAISGRENAVATLIDNGAKITDTAGLGQTVFHLVAIFGHLSILRVLWNRQRGKHADKEAIEFAMENNGFTPFSLAAAKGHVNIMAAMLERVSSSSNKIVKLQGDKTNALVAAVQGCNLEAVELLLSNDWDVNGKDEEGYGALHYAAGLGTIRIIEALIAKGAELNLPGGGGQMPLHMAAERNSDGVKAMLENNVTDINVLSAAIFTR